MYNLFNFDLRTNTYSVFNCSLYFTSALIKRCVYGLFVVAFSAAELPESAAKNRSFILPLSVCYMSHTYLLKKF